ncbi:unnamed protein product [Leuciscus chuanchicus]
MGQGEDSARQFHSGGNIVHAEDDSPQAPLAKHAESIETPRSSHANTAPDRRSSPTAAHPQVAALPGRRSDGQQLDYSAASSARVTMAPAIRPAPCYESKSLCSLMLRYQIESNLFLARYYLSQESEKL